MFSLPLCLNAAQITNTTSSYPRVTEDVAKKVAVNFMATRNKSGVEVKDVVVETREGLVTMYVCNFNDGGWVMVSADYSADPILAYSYEGAYTALTDSTDNLAFYHWLDAYKRGISYLDTLKSVVEDGALYAPWEGSPLIDVSDKWSVLENSTSLRGLSYIEGTNLLSDESRGGDVIWKQGYNKYCPKSEYSQQTCEHSIAGCGSIAMAQVLWKWAWPTYSYVVDKHGEAFSDRYDWNLMPAQSTNDKEFDEISRFVSRCGFAQYSKYSCGATSTFAINAPLALGDFGYNSLGLETRSDWSDEGWHRLLTSELRAGRPIYYCGQSTSGGHAFVLSGYQYREADGQYYYCVNYGWGGSDNGYYNVDMTNMMGSNGEVVGSKTYKFDSYQEAIVGISPYTRNFCEENTSVLANQSFSKYSATSLVIPCYDEFVAEDKSKVELKAKERIVLKSGFSAKKGSKVSASIAKDVQNAPNEIDIYALLVNSESGTLSVDVRNANSWVLKIIKSKHEYTVIGASRKTSGIMYENYFSDAGSIEEDGLVEVMKNATEDYTGKPYELFLLNNNGIIKKLSGTIGSSSYQICNVQGEEMSYGSSNGSIELGDPGLTEVKESIEIHHLSFVYPNPTTGKVTISLGNTQANVTVSDMKGSVIASQNATGDLVVDMSSHNKGVYLVKVVSDTDIKVEKLILK